MSHSTTEELIETRLASICASENGKKRTALVTGGAGFIGSHVVELLHNHPKIALYFGTVIVLDNMSTGSLKNLQEVAAAAAAQQDNGVEVASTAQALQPLKQAGAIFEQFSSRLILVKDTYENKNILNAIFSIGIDYVFHLGAKISVAESTLVPLAYEQSNVQGTIILLEQAKAHGVKTLVFSSSGSIYGTNPVVPKFENMIPEPLSPYAQTKLTGEFYLRHFSSDKFKTVALRYFNVFGERQNPKSAYAAAVPAFVAAVKEGQPITIFGDGLQTRDFVYSKDVALANLYTALYSPKEFDIYNVGYANSISIVNLAKTVIDHFKSGTEIVYGPARPGDVRESVANTDKLRGIGWAPSFDFFTAFKKVADYIMKTQY